MAALARVADGHVSRSGGVFHHELDRPRRGAHHYVLGALDLLSGNSRGAQEQSTWWTEVVFSQWLLNGRETTVAGNRHELTLLRGCRLAHALGAGTILAPPASQREMKIAVIENEYGAVSIDTALVQENVREVSAVVCVRRQRVA